MRDLDDWSAMVDHRFRRPGAATITDADQP
jgi:hypothetical protein